MKIINTNILINPSIAGSPLFSELSAEYFDHYILIDSDLDFADSLAFLLETACKTVQIVDRLESLERLFVMNTQLVRYAVSVTCYGDKQLKGI
ncbi:hypothetical protein [Sphingobacterium bambusae]|uniref:Uncharacterized protein n=1 Tax=Sphingobacterium bambusae TaxID=662858 RepID=A0ABW6BD79_9SPHI|nr:hypothetical protein [Sphingobacterium bambusae]WPL48767.1 hypothetical protein SCB77_22715 [Sphingobacterium bambusae]